MTIKFLVRYGEIALKGKNRGTFEQQLQQNLKGAVKHCNGQIKRLHGRFIVEGPAEREQEMIDRLCRVFGVVSVSVIEKCELDLEAIKQAVLNEITRKQPELKSFKIVARRSNKKFAYDSPELNQLLGAHVLNHFPDLKVSMHEPDLAVAVEIGMNEAYLYHDRQAGLGGLPVGVSGRGLLLLSGGIDSPVAGWLAMKRGLTIEALHFHSYPFTSQRSQEKTVDLCRKLARYSHKVMLHMISLTEIQKELRANCPAELSVILLRRMMFRLAERLSAERSLKALITGENLGQVASQTLESMTVISEATSMLTLRPLLGMDKAEIIKRAIAIDTYNLSILPYEDCCTLFVPKRPTTRPKLEVVLNYEQKLDLEQLLAEAMATLQSEAIRD